MCQNGDIIIESEIIDYLPSHMRHPEFHLNPLSLKIDKGLSFFFNIPDYVEIPEQSVYPDDLYFVKDEKNGILYWHFKKQSRYTENNNKRIVSCELED